MAVDSGGTIAAVSLEAAEFRRIIRGTAPPGVLKSGDLNVTQNGTPNLTVNIAAGEAFIESGVAGGGLYYFRNPATENLAVTQTSAIVARVYDSEVSGSTDAMTLEAVAGSTAPSGSLKLAQVTVSGSTIVNANIASHRYRSTNVVKQYLFNAQPETGLIGGPQTIGTWAIDMPQGWAEYDVHVTGKMVFQASEPAGSQSRFTTISTITTGSIANEGRVSMVGYAAGGSSVYATDPIDIASTTGLTASTNFRYQTWDTAGHGGQLYRGHLIATLTRVR